MPFIEQTPFNIRGQTRTVDPAFEYSPDYWNEVVPAAFRLENTFTSFLENNDPTDNRIDNPDFDPFEIMPDEHRNFADRYAFADSISEVTQIRDQINKELDDRRTLSYAGWQGFAATFTAGLIDPINLIPIGGAAYRTYRIGGSILRGAMTTGTAGLAAASIAEGLLHQSQITRTAGESAINMTGAMFLSAILGGSIIGAKNLFGSKVIDDIAPRIEDDLEVTNFGSVGSATTRLNKEQAGIKSNAAVRAFVAVGLAKIDPVTRSMTNDLAAARIHMPDLAETPYTLTRNTLGEATPLSVERRARNWVQTNLVNGLVMMDNSYVQYAKGRSKRFGDIFSLGVTNAARRISGTDRNVSRKLTYKEFRVEVGRAMRRNDEHEIPEVAASAQAWRKELFGPMSDDLVELGLLPEGITPTTAPSYLMRVWDNAKLSQAGPNGYGQKFVNTTAEWLRTRQFEARQRVESFDVRRTDIEAEFKPQREALAKQEEDIAAVNKRIEPLAANRERFEKRSPEELDLLAQRLEIEARAKPLRAELRTASARIKELQKINKRDKADIEKNDLELLDIAEQVKDRILGSPAGRLPYDLQTKRGGGRGPTARPLHNRAFLIPDEMVEDFLIDDIEVIAKMYTRSLSADIELVRKYGLEVFDDVQWAPIREITEEASAVARKVTEKKAGSINRNKDKTITDFLSVRDRLRHVHGLPDDPKAILPRIGRGLLKFNFFRMLGGMTASAIPDTARITMVHGLSRTFGTILKPALKDMPSLMKSTAEVRAMGAASDMKLNSRMQAIGDIGEEFNPQTKLERTMAAMTDTFGMVSVMAPWNTFWKSLAGSATQSRIIKAIRAEADGKITRAEAEYLRASGIDQGTGRNMLRQINEHGGAEGDVELSGWLNWTNKELRVQFQSAINRQTDIIIVTPGQDIPLIATKSTVGRLVFQFKSFVIASNQRMLLAGLQQADMAFMNGILMSVTAGMLTYIFKTWDAGREVDWSVDTMIKEGVDRSGIISIPFEMNNILEKISRGTLGLSPIMGGQPMSRYASRSAVGAMFGPSFGTLTETVGLLGSLATVGTGNGDVTPEDIHAARKLLPYQNLLLIRQLFDKIEEATQDVL